MGRVQMQVVPPEPTAWKWTSLRQMEVVQQPQPGTRGSIMMEVVTKVVVVLDLVGTVVTSRRSLAPMVGCMCTGMETKSTITTHGLLTMHGTASVTP